LSHVWKWLYYRCFLNAKFCFTGTRDQLNVVTSIVDGSNIYASREEDAILLRDLPDHTGGM